ncbi:MAG: Fic family protein [Pseudodesulfovibrio sp.]|nr:Fic family protein [Pseudodesulfovibrio sp.]
MATYSEKLTASLKKLRQLQRGGKKVLQSNDLSRVHRDRLKGAGYLEKIIPKWLMSKSPEVAKGDTTPWYSCCWEFCKRYCDSRFAKSWHLSPEQSLLIHSGDMSIPYQIIIYAKKGQQNLLELPFDVKLIDLAFPKTHKITSKDIEEVNGVNVLNLPLALSIVQPAFFQNKPAEAEMILGTIEDASRILPPLLARGRTTAAGRLAGAFRHIGRESIADEICDTMKDAGHEIIEDNPFTGKQTIRTWTQAESPVVARIKTLWGKARPFVIKECANEPLAENDTNEYLASVDEAYTHDAYHSLSIEGYMVSDVLINRVAAGNWNPEDAPHDENEKNAMACRGYWECFTKVKDSVKDVLAGEQAGAVARRDHRSWYRALFSPHVKAGLLDGVVLAGYRNHPVFIKGSRHVPINEASVLDAMNALFDCLKNETSPFVAATLGHWLFGYIHPYTDGNGRMARFLMNLMLASGGYSWTTIEVGKRDDYMAALDAASVESDIKPFAQFISQCVFKDDS